MAWSLCLGRTASLQPAFPLGRYALLVAACGLTGCLSFPHARLLSGRMAREVVTGPVVCGPVGFRKVPLQSRWGEYVRVTVSAPGALSGSVLVHAGGVAQEPRTWNTQSDGALVVDARFPNEDVDQRFALERERPIDLTLTGLEGACEGAVFTVEHGELVPSIDERAWIAELERRGGPELAARREAARLEADARRQAHYAQWESRQVEVSAEVVAQASLLREAHYAQWEARQAIGETDAVAVSTGDVAAGSVDAHGAGPNFGAGVAASGGVNGNSLPCAAGTCAGPNFGGGVAASGGVKGNVALCASGTCAGPKFGGGGGVNGHSVACASGTCGNSGSVATGGNSAWCTSGTCAGPNFGGGVATSVNVNGNAQYVPDAHLEGPNFGSGVAASGGVNGNATPCASGTCGLNFGGSGGVNGHSVQCASGTCSGPNFGSGGAASGLVNANDQCASGTCSGPNLGSGGAAPGLVNANAQCASGTCSGPNFGSGGTASGRVNANAAPCASGTCVGQRFGVDTAPVNTVTLPGEWIRPPDATLRATLDTAWVQPPDAHLRATATIEPSWEEAFAPAHLEPVAITTESRVVTTQQPTSPACHGNCTQPVDPSLSVFVPAMLHLMFNVAAGASQQQPAHAAVPPRR